MRIPLASVCALALLLTTSTPAHADLIDLGNGMIYDTVQDLTWLDPSFASPPRGWEDAPHDNTWDIGYSCYQSQCDWHYTWAQAVLWVESLNYAGYDDWRLPDKFFPSYEGGENEWQRALQQLPGWAFEFRCADLSETCDGTSQQYPELINVGSQGPFQEPLPYAFVWMDEPYIYPLPFFHPGAGYDFPSGIDSFAGIVRPVRDGRATVPEPATALLVTLGVAGVALRRRKRPASN